MKQRVPWLYPVRESSYQIWERACQIISRGTPSFVDGLSHLLFTHRTNIQCKSLLIFGDIQQGRLGCAPTNDNCCIGMSCIDTDQVKRKTFLLVIYTVERACGLSLSLCPGSVCSSLGHTDPEYKQKRRWWLAFFTSASVMTQSFTVNWKLTSSQAPSYANK